MTPTATESATSAASSRKWITCTTSASRANGCFPFIRPLCGTTADIAEYTEINEIYGSLADLKLLLRETASARHAVINELVINHTSDKHPWFQALAARAECVA